MNSSPKSGVCPVKEDEFDSELQAAARAGFDLINRLSLRRSHAAVLKRN